MDNIGRSQTENLSEALRHLVDSFGAETGTLHLLEEDGLLHLKALAGEFPPSVLAVMQKNSGWQRYGGPCR